MRSVLAILNQLLRFSYLDHSYETLPTANHHTNDMDCNIVNEAICFTTTVLVIRVVIGGWKKSLVFVLVLRFNVASVKISKVKYSKILMLPMGVSVSLRQLSLIR